MEKLLTPKNQMTRQRIEDAVTRLKLWREVQPNQLVKVAFLEEAPDYATESLASYWEKYFPQVSQENPGGGWRAQIIDQYEEAKRIHDSFEAISGDLRQQIFGNAIERWQNTYANVRFELVNDPAQADVRVGLSDNVNINFAPGAQPTANGAKLGDVYLNTSLASTAAGLLGDHALTTMFHEFGHVLGLSHADDGNRLPVEYGAMQHGVMGAAASVGLSFTSLTPMLFEALDLQKKGLLKTSLNQRSRVKTAPHHLSRVVKTLASTALFLLLVLPPASAQVVTSAATPATPTATSASVSGAPAGTVRRLKRSKEVLGQVDDHPCTMERKYREEDYLAALTDVEIATYLKLAANGDADAMFLLSQLPKETPDGKREYPYRVPWLTRAAEAGHPIARYLLAEEAHRQKSISDDEYLALIEAAALAQGSGDIAWRLAYSYLHPTAEKGDVIFKIPRNFLFLKGNQAKALEWARIAAGKGNMMAAEDLCTTMTFDTLPYTYGLRQRDPVETVRWCTTAAQAACSGRAALMLASLYEAGIGIEKSKLDALYWRRVYLERRQKNFVSVDKWDY